MEEHGGGRAAGGCRPRSISVQGCHHVSHPTLCRCLTPNTGLVRGRVYLQVEVRSVFGTWVDMDGTGMVAVGWGSQWGTERPPQKAETKLRSPGSLCSASGCPAHKLGGLPWSCSLNSGLSVCAPLLSVFCLFVSLFMYSVNSVLGHVLGILGRKMNQTGACWPRNSCDSTEEQSRNEK